MSRKFGTVRQIGLVVRDARATMRYWAEALGIGPFFVVDGASFTEYCYRGQPGPSPIMTIGYAQMGNLQIEIIEQTNDAPSGYLDFLRAGREGCQHLASWFDNRAAFDAAYHAALTDGAEVVHEGLAGAARFAYFATHGGRADGLSFEIAEGLLPDLAPIHALLADASTQWDGSNPVRALASA